MVGQGRNCRVVIRRGRGGDKIKEKRRNLIKGVCSVYLKVESVCEDHLSGLGLGNIEEWGINGKLKIPQS